MGLTGRRKALAGRDFVMPGPARGRTGRGRGRRPARHAGGATRLPTRSAVPALRASRIARRAVVPRAGSARVPGLHGDLVRLLRLASASAPGTRLRRDRPGPTDLHLVVRLVAARAP